MPTPDMLIIPMTNSVPAAACRPEPLRNNPERRSAQLPIRITTPGIRFNRRKFRVTENSSPMPTWPRTLTARSSCAMSHPETSGGPRADIGYRLPHRTIRFHGSTQFVKQLSQIQRPAAGLVEPPGEKRFVRSKLVPHGFKHVHKRRMRRVVWPTSLRTG